MRTGKVEIEREGDREQWNCTEGDRDKLREDAIDRGRVGEWCTDCERSICST